MLCDSLESWAGAGDGREGHEGGDMCILWLIHVLVWQEPAQRCKAITLLLKINLKNKLDLNKNTTPSLS